MPRGSAAHSAPRARDPREERSSSYAYSDSEESSTGARAPKKPLPKPEALRQPDATPHGSCKPKRTAPQRERTPERRGRYQTAAAPSAGERAHAAPSGRSHGRENRRNSPPRRSGRAEAPAGEDSVRSGTRPRGREGARTRPSRNKSSPSRGSGEEAGVARPHATKETGRDRKDRPHARTSDRERSIRRSHIDATRVGAREHREACSPRRSRSPREQNREQVVSARNQTKSPGHDERVPYIRGPRLLDAAAPQHGLTEGAVFDASLQLSNLFPVLQAFHGLGVPESAQGAAVNMSLRAPSVKGRQKCEWFIQCVMSFSGKGQEPNLALHDKLFQLMQLRKLYAGDFQKLTGENAKICYLRFSDLLMPPDLQQAAYRESRIAGSLCDVSAFLLKTSRRALRAPCKCKGAPPSKQC